jgi:UPF0755 protein
LKSKIEPKNSKVSKPKIRKRIITLLVLVFIIAVTVICGYYSYTFVLDSSTKVGKDSETPPLVSPEEGIALEIPMGSSTADIAEILNKNNIIKYPKVFKILSKLNGYDGTYKSGIHLISQQRNYNTINGYDELMRILSSMPKSDLSVNVTIPEGYNYIQIVELFSQKKLIDKDKFIGVANNEKFDYKFLKGIPSREFILEGYLFPETYAFDPKGGEKEVIGRMLEQFDKVFLPEYYERAKELDMTVDEVITLASIIERETKLPEERAIVSGVFHNRLNAKDKTLRKLQSCATIQYIIYKRDGKVKEIITLDDEKIDDPYNTYMFEGLPPGPICSPGKESIVAALYPMEHDYMYFVLKEDGTGAHHFSKTYQEHLNAQKKAQQNKK